MDTSCQGARNTCCLPRRTDPGLASMPQCHTFCRLERPNLLLPYPKFYERRIILLALERLWLRNSQEDQEILEMKSKWCIKILFNGYKFFMVLVTFLWPTEYEHLNLAKLMYSVEAPVQDRLTETQQLHTQKKVNDFITDLNYQSAISIWAYYEETSKTKKHTQQFLRQPLREEENRDT